MTNLLLIRADGSLRSGTGHVMRCLALAQCWRQRGGAVIFAHAETTSALAARLQNEHFDSRMLNCDPGSSADVEQTIALAREHKPAWVVADGYRFDAIFQRQLKSAGLRLLVIDDYGHANHYYADLVLNQNLGANPARYVQSEPYTRVLLGTRYSLLRREFLEWAGCPREIPPVARKVLVTLGGSDPDNVTGKMIDALKQLPDIEGVVALGGSNPHHISLHSLISKQCHPGLRSVVNAINIPELMAWADMAVAAAGSTAWELAYMGLPALVFVLAENQSAIAANLVSANVAIGAIDPSHVTAVEIAARLDALLHNRALRATMSAAGRQLVDGSGAERIVDLLTMQKSY